jgi:hypothetical protein
METHPSRDISGECIIGVKPYRELIGCLKYACLGTRPDVCVAVQFHSQFQSNATETQRKGLKRILRYLKGTGDFGLWFRGSAYSPLQLYVDANFANDFIRKSVSGFLLKFYGDSVVWGTRKQTAVA